MNVYTFNLISNSTVRARVDDLVKFAAGECPYWRQARDLILGGYELSVFVEGQEPFHASWMLSDELEQLQTDLHGWFGLAT